MTRVGLKLYAHIVRDRGKHVSTGGCGVPHPQSFTQSENLRVVGKFKAFQKKLVQSE